MDYLVSSPLRQEEQVYGDKFVRRMKRQYHEANILAVLKKYISATHPVSILEFGPGEGELTELLLEAFPQAELTAVDIDKGAIGSLSERFPLVKAVCTDDTVGFLKEKTNSYDIIVSTDVWEHLPKDNIVDITRACYDALQTGGIFVAQVPNMSSPLGPHTFALDFTHATPFTEFSARQLLTMSGFSDVQILPFKFPQTLLGRIRTALRLPVLACYTLLMYLLGHVRTRVLTPNLMMVARK